MKTTYSWPQASRLKVLVFLISTFFLCVAESSGQYISILGNDWMQHNISGNNRDVIGTGMYWEKNSPLHSDTVIDGLIYKSVIFQMEAVGLPVWNPYTDVIYIYEDTVVGKAHFYPITDFTKRYHIYDLQLAAGDTFWLTSDSTDFILIDSVYINNGRLVQLLEDSISTGTGTFQLKIYEGIGSNNSFLTMHGLGYGDSNYILVCAYRDDSIVYRTSLEGRDSICTNIGTQAPLLEPEKGLFIYPNPTQSTLQLNGLKEPQNYSIYTLQGSLAQTGRANPGEGIEVARLTKGMYVFQLETGERVKFVKE